MCLSTSFFSYLIFIYYYSSADIDEMKICYVLLDGSNATSDIFYFTVEDNGKNFFYLTILCVDKSKCLDFYPKVQCNTAGVVASILNNLGLFEGLSRGRCAMSVML